MKFAEFSSIVILFAVINPAEQLSLVGDRSIDKSPSAVFSDAIGLGLRGVLHYFLDLVENCDNVGNLNDWVMSLESYLSCEDSAWPTKSDEDLQKLTDMEVIDNYCKAWPSRLACTELLAPKLDACYNYVDSPSQDTSSHIKRTIGSDARIMSDTFSRRVCQDGSKYLDVLFKDEQVLADRRNLNCYVKNRAEILQCIWQRDSVGPKRTNVCSHAATAKECIAEGYSGQIECKTALKWINDTITLIENNLTC